MLVCMVSVERQLLWHRVRMTTISYGKRCTTHIDHPRCVTLFEVVQHGGLVEVGHHGHVLDLVELGRVHGEDFIILHRNNL